jgi:hypothetical protein
MPQSEWRVLCNPPEVDIRREHSEIVSNAQLREQHVDRSNLHVIAPAGISKLSRADVVFPIGYDQGKGGKAIDNGLTSLRARESLK